MGAWYTPELVQLELCVPRIRLFSLIPARVTFPNGKIIGLGLPLKLLRYICHRFDLFIDTCRRYTPKCGNYWGYNYTP